MSVPVDKYQGYKNDLFLMNIRQLLARDRKLKFLKWTPDSYLSDVQNGNFLFLKWISGNYSMEVRNLNL